MTRAELAARVLSKLTVLGIGVSASAADTALVGEAIDSAHAELRKEGLAPFALATTPEWAQIPLMDFVIADVGPHFGRPVDREAVQRGARRRLATQVAGYRHQPTKATYY